MLLPILKLLYQYNLLITCSWSNNIKRGNIMYDLAKKQSRIKAEEKERKSEQHVPSQLINLIEEGMRRQEEYIKMIQKLKEQKQQQAKQYVKKLGQFSKYLDEFKRKREEEEERKEFKSFEMKRQQEASRRQKQTIGKKEYTIQDINKFSLEIQLKFLFLNPLLEDPLSSYYPKRLDIRFNSLGLQFISGKIQYSQPQSQHRELLNDGYPLILESTGLKKNVCFNFSITPSKKHNINSIAQLLRLIKTQLLEIQLYDYDSNILFGTAYINLEQILHYGKTEDYWVQQAIVFSPLRSRDVAKIDIQFKNYKAPAANIDTIVIEAQKQSGNQSNKLKVTSNSPLDIESPQYDIRSIEEKERRLLRRINQHKEESIKLGKSVHINFEFDYMTNQVNKRKLDHILKIKEENKFNFSEEILSRIHEQFQSYECSIGNVLIIPFTFCNSSDQRVVFQVVPSEIMKQMKHVNIVTNFAECQFFKRDHQIVGQPANLDPQSLTFSLSASQSAFILIKYLTFTHIQERPLEMHIINTFNSNVLQTFVFKVKCIPETIDHRFRIFEGEGKITEMFIPYSQRRQDQAPFLFCKQAQVEYAWANNGFLLRVHVLKDQQIVVYLYESNDCRKLLKCYQIIIKKFIVIDFKDYELGLQKTVQLEIPSSQENNEVVFFSSDSQKLWSHTSRSLKIKPNTIESVTITGRTLYPEDQNIILTCNKTSGQIYSQWLFKFKVSKPTYKNIHQVIASTTKKISFTLEIQNPTNRTEALGVISNNQSYIQVQESKKVVNSGKMVFISLIINPHEEGEKDVIINVSNFDQSLNINYLMKLRFSRQYKQIDKTGQQIIYRRY